MTAAPVLGPSLSRLVAERGSPLTEAEPVSPLQGGATSRIAFRLRFADGVTLKGRRLETAQQAGTVWAMSRAVHASWSGAPLSRVRAWHGDALLEQWLPGRSLAGASLPPADLRKAGAMLARLHGAVPSLVRTDRPVDPEWVARSLDLAPIEAAGVPDAALAAAAVRLARRQVPETAEWGWCHGDFCAENLLRVPRRGLRLIDNETIGEHWFDHDLARTWYRWPLEPLQWECFLEGYARHRSIAAYERHADFWRVSVLLRATAFRLNHGLDASVPVARLAVLCRERAMA